MDEFLKKLILDITLVRYKYVEPKHRHLMSGLYPLFNNFDTLSQEKVDKNNAEVKHSISDLNLLLNEHGTQLRTEVDEDSINVLIRALICDPRKHVRAAVARALGILGSSSAIDPLIKALQDRNNCVRSAATNALIKLGDRHGLAAVRHKIWTERKDVFRRFIVENIIYRLKDISIAIADYFCVGTLYILYINLNLLLPILIPPFGLYWGTRLLHRSEYESEYPLTYSEELIACLKPKNTILLYLSSLVGCILWAIILTRLNFQYPILVSVGGYFISSLLILKSRLLCVIGVHKWHYTHAESESIIVPNSRICDRCGKTQDKVLIFNRGIFYKTRKDG